MGVYTKGGQNSRAKQYDTGGFLPYAPNALWIGEGLGSWHDMGFTLGLKAQTMIAASTDYWWGKMCEEKGKEETMQAMERYRFQIDALDPSQIELLEGISEGAKDALKEACYGDETKVNYADAFYRVLAASIFDCWLWGKPDDYQDAKAEAHNQAGIYIDGGCNSVACKGTATKNGQTISSQVRHTQQAGLCYQASMTYQGQDGLKVWSVGNVPSPNGLLLVNEKGVSISHHFGGSTTENSLHYSGGPYYGSAYGVPWPNLLFYTIKHAKNAQEALDLLAHGSPRYRDITGRKTVLRDGTWNWMVCDEKTLSVMEVSPDRYAIRYAGEYTEDWTDPDYIACANHFQCTYSYDENDIRTDIPMTMFNANNNSKARFWTLMWEMKDAKGKLDVETLQHIFIQTYLRDKETGAYILEMEDKEGQKGPTGEVYGCVQGKLLDHGLSCGTNAAKIAVLNEKPTCYFCLGNPMDWQGAWDKYKF